MKKKETFGEDCKGRDGKGISRSGRKVGWIAEKEKKEEKNIQRKAGRALPVRQKEVCAESQDRKRETIPNRFVVKSKKKEKVDRMSRAPQNPWILRVVDFLSRLGLLMVTTMASDGRDGGGGVVGRVLRMLSPAPGGSSGDSGGIVRELRRL